MNTFTIKIKYNDQEIFEKGLDSLNYHVHQNGDVVPIASIWISYQSDHTSAFNDADFLKSFVGKMVSLIIKKEDTIIFQTTTTINSIDVNATNTLAGLHINLSC